MRPHNLPFVLLGVGLLWFGWFGFNAGSALAADGMASAILLNTLLAGCLGMLGWLSVEQVRDGKPTTFGAASGVVAGLVGITPSCGTVNPLGAAIVGLLAGIVCSFAIGLKFKLNYDDSLDVVGVHFVGGVVGKASGSPIEISAGWNGGGDGPSSAFTPEPQIAATVIDAISRKTPLGEERPMARRLVLDLPLSETTVKDRTTIALMPPGIVLRVR
jgi:hypothetical protein